MDETDKQATRRKQLRLPNYDYRQNGAYYVTICTHNRAALFGLIEYVGAHPCVRPSIAGTMVKEKLFALEQKFDGVKIAGRTHGCAPTPNLKVVQNANDE